MRCCAFISVLFAVVVSTAPPARAATLSLDENFESSGDFSSTFTTPKIISSDVATVSGRQNWVRDRDYFLFDEFEPGTERVDFTFSNVGGNWGTFNLQVKYSPFTTQWEWRDLEADQYGWTNDSQDWMYSFTLPEGYAGPLYAMIRFTSGDFFNGDGIDYKIEKQELTPSPAPVPLPATFPFLLAGCATLLALRRHTLRR